MTTIRVPNNLLNNGMLTDASICAMYSSEGQPFQMDESTHWWEHVDEGDKKCADNVAAKSKASNISLFVE